MKFSIFVATLSQLLASSHGFTVVAPKSPSVRLGTCSCSLNAHEPQTQPSNNVNLLPEKLLHALGTLTVAASFLTFQPNNVQAMDFMTNDAVLSSSIQLSEEIKVLDMSLPSYGSISAPKSGQEAIKGVEVDPNKPSTSTSASTSVLPTKKKGGGAISLYSSGSSKKKETKKAVASSAPAAPKEEKQESGPAVITVDMSMPSYGDTTAKKEKSVFAL